MKKTGTWGLVSTVKREGVFFLVWFETHSEESGWDPPRTFVVRTNKRVTVCTQTIPTWKEKFRESHRFVSWCAHDK
jgi:hypothetical protein